MGAAMTTVEIKKAKLAWASLRIEIRGAVIRGTPTRLSRGVRVGRDIYVIDFRTGHIGRRV